MALSPAGFDVPFAQTVTLVTKTKSGVDKYGKDVYTTTTTDSPGWVLWPQGLGTEQAQGQDITTDNLTALAPVGTNPSFIDQVRWNGRTYEVQGTTWSWNHPMTGTAAGVQVELRYVSG